MSFKFVSNKSIISKFKSSKLFKTDLGRSFTNSGKGGIKADFSRQEDFVRNYYEANNQMLHKEGNIGKIEFYSDFRVNNKIKVFYENYDFIFDYDMTSLRDKGVEAYLGSILKDIEINLLPNMKPKKVEKIELSEEQRIALAQQKIKTNPGAVTYDDIKDIIKAKRGRI